MSKTKKKSLKLEVQAQLDGKCDDKPQVQIAGSLDSIMGECLSLYSVRNIEDYKNQISEMNQTDLQTHAYKIGLVPIEDRRVLISRLCTEFERWNTRMSPHDVGGLTKTINDIDNRAQKILREGA
jgi:hypothetical protein